MSNKIAKEFKLEFSNRVIEHLGIKLYQNKPTNVVAEFVSNSWDSDAEKVSINLIAEPEISIIITDNGRGMTRNELIDEFLVIGRNRRLSPSDRTEAHRRPMGRKGIGKLAAFGIARTVDILSVPNLKRRINKNDAEPKLYWLRFHLDGILAASTPTGESGYPPDVIADGIPLNEIDNLFAAKNLQTQFKEFKKNVDTGEGGVCVYLHNTTLKNAINPDVLLSSLAHRFTVTMLRPDFDVKVNDKKVDPKSALPRFLEHKVGSIETPNIEKIKIGDVEREVKFWVGFVSLKDSEWPIENAGIGVYTHGKIAQDRPFFFGVKGKEIFSRYIYGVVEADWLDELPDDVVSTDRRSINWEDDATQILHTWGTEKLSAWISGFREWKKSQPHEEIKKRIRKIPGNKLTGAEEDALAELLTEVFLTLGNDDDAKTNAINSITSAWTHEPTRKLTQSLWSDVLKNQNSNPNIFVSLVEKLKESMVPEAMGLAVTMAQRIGAITSLKKAIDFKKNETYLQRLIENFPWLLGPEWEKLTANQTIRTLVESQYKPKVVNTESGITNKEKKLRPDFVFLSDVGTEAEIIVVELKGPEDQKTLQPAEYFQLRDYLDIISASYNNDEINVRGWIIGHEIGGFKIQDTRITAFRWSDVFASARKLHVSYLASLLQASDPLAGDQRIKQISDFGGKETIELLKRLNVMVDYNEELKKSILTN